MVRVCVCVYKLPPPIYTYSIWFLFLFLSLSSVVYFKLQQKENQKFHAIGSEKKNSSLCRSSVQFFFIFSLIQLINNKVFFVKIFIAFLLI
jgi:hypothetical protein